MSFAAQEQLLLDLLFDAQCRAPSAVMLPACVITDCP